MNTSNQSPVSHSFYPHYKNTSRRATQSMIRNLPVPKQNKHDPHQAPEIGLLDILIV
ncbi:hypothetical protein JAAARDRAFT_32100 [Jaapia argillacea MUCL 33604]|uniref:Uncharacterized protein n=1 Tax=Jaapia argillacea MUCL 33604 TaxID=933084 RepID=A0A067QC71_9AGAM|nr:hypothetical protein JAAARDRAFT_32100 [Jaapia argillacea MUCL 33604]